VIRIDAVWLAVEPLDMRAGTLTSEVEASFGALAQSVRRWVGRPVSRKIAAIPADFADRLADIKARVASARQRAALAANAELIRLYL